MARAPLRISRIHTGETARHGRHGRGAGERSPRRSARRQPQPPPQPPPGAQIAAAPAFRGGRRAGHRGRGARAGCAAGAGRSDRARLRHGQRERAAHRDAVRTGRNQLPRLRLLLSRRGSRGRLRTGLRSRRSALARGGKGRHDPLRRKPRSRARSAGVPVGGLGSGPRAGAAMPVDGGLLRSCERELRRPARGGAGVGARVGVDVVPIVALLGAGQSRRRRSDRRRCWGTRRCCRRSHRRTARRRPQQSRRRSARWRSC